MFILIDTTNHQALARHSSARALMALHYIQFANVDSVVIAEGANKGWAQLDRVTMANVIKAVGYNGPWPDAYSDLIKLARAVTEALDAFVLPYELDQLDAQAHSIDPASQGPLNFNPDGIHPVVANAWTVAPQQAAPRHSSTFALEFSAGTAGVIPRMTLPGSAAGGKVQAHSVVKNKKQTSVVPPTKEPTMATAKKAAAKKASVKKTAGRKAAPKPPKAAAPKAPKAPKAGKADKTILAPREGGITRKIWDACEKLLASKGACPAFSAVNAKLGDSIAIATQRSTYAYWRRAKGFTGRVVA